MGSTKYYAVAIYLLSTVFASCSKRDLPQDPPKPVVNKPITRGLPDEPRRINGYLFAGILNDQYVGFRRTALKAFFGDPDMNLLSCFDHRLEMDLNANSANILVGTVNFNNTELKIQGTSYQSFFFPDSLFTPDVVHWAIEGNGSFKPFSLDLPRNTPVIGGFNSKDTIKISQGFTLNVNEMVTDFDSVSVYFYSADENPIQKTVGTETKMLIFSEKELASVLDDYFPSAIGIYAYNYSHMITNGKVYLFENSTKIKSKIIVAK